MMHLISKAWRKFQFPRFKYGMQAWSYKIAHDVSLSQTVEVVQYLKEKANIAPEQGLLSAEKNADLVSNVKSRKLTYFIVFPFLCLSGACSIILFALAFACVLDGKKCSAPGPEWLVVGFAIASIVFAGLLLITNNISRDRREVFFDDQLSDELSANQIRDLAREARELKNNSTPLFEVCNYDRFRELGTNSWTAENWFLLLSSNEETRQGVWLDGRAPVGKIYIMADQLDEDLEGADFPWSRVYSKSFRKLVSNKDKLESFIDKKKQLPLSDKKRVWLETFEELLEDHISYKDYLSKTMTSTDRDIFLNKLARILAQNSDRYSESLAQQGVDKIDYVKIGASGTKKFLFGRNENVENWIKKYLGIT